MTFYYRHGGQWVQVTEVRSPAGAVSSQISSPSGWVNTNYLLTGSPPTRSTTEYSSNYSDLQTALDSIGSDTRLVIDDGPHSGNWNLARTSHVTIDGNGTTLDRADTSDQLVEYHDTGNEFSTNRDGVGTYSIGDSAIEVSATDIYSAGDEIRIFDTNQYHPDQLVSSPGEDQAQGSYHVVESIDSSNNLLYLEEDLFLDWDNPSGTLRVDRVDWGVEDVVIRDLTLEGNDAARDASRVNQFRRVKELWFDNCTVQNGTGGLWIYECYQVRIHNCTLDELGRTENANRYPVDITNGTTHTYITDSESLNSDRYGFKSGAGGSWFQCRNGRMENCHVSNSYQRGYDQHPGSRYWEYIDCTVDGGGGFGRARSDGWYAEGGGVTGAGQLIWYDRQAAEARNHVFKHHYPNSSGANRVYRILDDAGTNKYLDWTDVWVEETSNMYDCFNFRCDSGTLNVEVTLENIAMDGTWITDSNWSEYHSISENGGTVNVTVNSITAPSSQTPSEYFSDQYGWSSGTL